MGDGLGACDPGQLSPLSSTAKVRKCSAAAASKGRHGSHITFVVASVGRRQNCSIPRLLDDVQMAVFASAKKSHPYTDVPSTSVQLQKRHHYRRRQDQLEQLAMMLHTRRRLSTTARHERGTAETLTTRLLLLLLLAPEHPRQNSASRTTRPASTDRRPTSASTVTLLVD